MQINKLLITALLAVSAHAGTLLEVGPPGSAYFASPPIGFDGAYASGFTLDKTYSNVNLEAMIGATATYPAGNAYLMRSIGAGTTSASEIDSRTINFPIVPNLLSGSFQSIFSGLTLTAGDYYLVISTPVGATDFLGVFLGATVNTAPGVSFTGSFGRVPSAAYAPASDFVSYTPADYRIRVSGDPVDTFTPEPASAALTAVALLAAGFLRRRIFPMR